MYYLFKRSCNKFQFSCHFFKRNNVWIKSNYELSYSALRCVYLYQVFFGNAKILMLFSSEVINKSHFHAQLLGQKLFTMNKFAYFTLLLYSVRKQGKRIFALLKSTSYLSLSTFSSRKKEEEKVSSYYYSLWCKRTQNRPYAKRCAKKHASQHKTTSPLDKPI